ncbi:polysaccharide lyase family 3 protein [Rhizoctonia solani AG-1 IA]|uniref:Probable pectate lyase F n=1 Tax=Thanatephorus cucumeris (strain AG1-IA) TaxID=983506 RepID=L8WR77_THACA|nr:polysaccharide lyase family 3 protein [Rhizoctonia solani AG-1 IA]
MIGGCDKLSCTRYLYTVTTFGLHLYSAAGLSKQGWLRMLTRSISNVSPGYSAKTVAIYHWSSSTHASPFHVQLIPTSHINPTPLSTIIAVAAFFAQAAIAAPSPTIDTRASFMKRAASCTFPTPPKTSSLSAPMSVKGTFDGGNVRFDRGKGACSGQKEGGDKDAVFLLENGATLKNVVIGADQAEGVHCKGSCTIENVWFEDVCEDAITIRQTSGTTTIRGGGAKGASDKVVQHNGGGTVNISSYCVQDFGKLYRACGNCKTQYKRTVNISDVIAKNGSLLAGINSNYGDVATISNVTPTSVKSMCDTFQGNNSGKEPTKLTSNKVTDECWVLQLQVLIDKDAFSVRYRVGCITLERMRSFARLISSFAISFRPMTLATKQQGFYRINLLLKSRGYDLGLANSLALLDASSLMISGEPRIYYLGGEQLELVINPMAQITKSQTNPLLTENRLSITPLTSRASRTGTFQDVFNLRLSFFLMGALSKRKRTARNNLKKARERRLRNRVERHTNFLRGIDPIQADQYVYSPDMDTENEHVIQEPYVPNVLLWDDCGSIVSELVENRTEVSQHDFSNENEATAEEDSAQVYEANAESSTSVEETPSEGPSVKDIDHGLECSYPDRAKYAISLTDPYGPKRPVRDASTSYLRNYKKIFRASKKAIAATQSLPISGESWVIEDASYLRPAFGQNGIAREAKRHRTIPIPGCQVGLIPSCIYFSGRSHTLQ